jgi:ABC-type glycerol-3-phosphate transport system substrate-binding protein
MSARRDEHRWEQVLDGDVSPEAVAHVIACSHCAEMIRGVDRAVGAVRAGLAEPSAELDERVLGALAREGRLGKRVQPARRRQLRLSPAGAAVVAGFAAVVLALVLWPLGDAERAQAVPITPLSGGCNGPDSTNGRILVAGVWAGAEARSFAKVLRRFEERTGVRVSYAYETRDIPAKIEQRLRRGCPPDVALLPQPGLLADLARRHRIQPLDRRTAALVRRSYSAEWRRLATIGGLPYGIWFKAADKSMIWYRPGALRAAGVTRAPATWAQLLDVAARVRATGLQPFAVAGGDGWTITDWFENVFLRMAGPRRYDQLARHRIPWSHPSVRRALGVLAQVLRDPALSGTPLATLDTTFEQSVRDVYSARPRAAMVFEADFVRSFVPRGAAPAFFPFPAVRAGSARDLVVGGDVAAMFSRSNGARQLMRFLATPEAARIWARDGGFLSPNRRVPGSAYPDALSRRAARALTAARTVRFDLSDLQPPAFGATEGQGMWSILRDLLRTPDAATATARRLETAAAAAFACEKQVQGSC